jgi:hypothetical protein
MGGSYTEYLRKRDKDQKKQKVDEALFHQHYREVLQFSALFGIVASEVIDKAGGRTDILVSFGAVQFNVECKIEETTPAKPHSVNTSPKPPNTKGRENPNLLRPAPA